MMHLPADDRRAENGVGAANVVRHWRLRVDTSERHAALLDLARGCGDFAICMERLAVGDYLIDDGIVIERKTYSDCATSLVDGRLFPQAAALARCPHRPIVLLEGPAPAQMPDVHAHALKGAMLSLANRLLVHFGSVERVITADQGLLAQVRGIGSKKAQQIRNVIS